MSRFMVLPSSLGPGGGPVLRMAFPGLRAKSPACPHFIVSLSTRIARNASDLRQHCTGWWVSIGAGHGCRQNGAQQARSSSYWHTGLVNPSDGPRRHHCQRHQHTPPHPGSPQVMYPRRAGRMNCHQQQSQRKGTRCKPDSWPSTKCGQCQHPLGRTNRRCAHSTGPQGAAMRGEARTTN